MELYFHRRYLKQYQKLPHFMQMKVDRVIKKFSKNPHTISLRNHALRGEFKGERAISVAPTTKSTSFVERVA